MNLTSASPPRYFVTALTRRDAPALGRLRRRCFLRSPTVRWRDVSTLDWTEDDDAAVVLGVWTDDGELVATNRATLRADKAAAEDLLGYATDLSPQRYPAFVCGRTATDSSHGRQGLTALSRYVIVEHAQRLGIAALVAIVYSNSPRLASMQAHGYEFSPCARHWDAEADPLTDPLVITMAAQRFAGCLARIERDSAALLATVRFDHGGIRAAFDRNVLHYLGPVGTEVLGVDSGCVLVAAA